MGRLHHTTQPRHKQKFNRDISKWNTSRVVTMESAFQGTAMFNAPVGDWDVSQVSAAAQRTCGLGGLPRARHWVLPVRVHSGG